MNKHHVILELNKILELLANQTSCADSRELALAIQPEAKLSFAQSLLNQTSDAHMLLARFGSPSMGGLINVVNPLKRAQAGGSLSMRELLNVASTLGAIRTITTWRERCSGVQVCLDLYFNGMEPNKYLEQKIQASILSEDEVADNASGELASIRKKIKLAAARIREQLDKLIRSAYYQKFLQEPIVTQRNGRFVVPVKAECRGDIPGLVHDTSSSGATVFVEPMSVVEANNDIKVLESQEQAEIERILDELSGECGTFAESIISSYECCVEIDLIMAKAKLAYDMKASLPLLNDDGIIDIKRARHPLIKPSQVVPIDIRVGGDFTTLVITGPNTGGKTVSIKTLGLLTLMAMCGLMIPAADESRVSVFDRVLADIGDEQSIEQSLSTFSSHITNIIEIIKETDDKTLVLIDELGAGTDPVEGAALAISILESLSHKGAKIAATTHYAELKAYAIQTPLVENACCEFDVQTLRPMYRLLIGVPGSSNAFAISRRLGMDGEIVDRAQELISNEDIRFEDVVKKLEVSRRDMEKSRSDANAALAESEKLKAEIAVQKRRLDEQEKKALEQARFEAKQIVDKARSEAHVLLDELDELRRKKQTEDAQTLAMRARSEVKSKLRKLDELADPVEGFEKTDGVPDDEYSLPRPLKVGDIVLVPALGGNAEVVSLADKSGNIQVRAGAIMTRVKQKSVRLVGAAKKKEQPKGRVVKNVANKATDEVKMSLDLRGKLVDEGIDALDSYIDKSLLMGIPQFTVIHGKGTGAMRSAVQQALRRNPFVRTYRLGEFGEGGDGVTIVELK